MESKKVIDKNAKRTRTEVWSRVMGYQRPVDFYNIGKRSEFYSRKYFDTSSVNADFNKKFAVKEK